MGGKLFGYARVSTDAQCLQRQVDILKKYGVGEPDIFCDKYTGMLSSRPAFDELNKMLRPGDTVLTESLSRLSRRTSDLLGILNEWSEKGIVYISLKEQIDISSSTGKLMLTLMAALSQFERDIITERVREGVASARVRGRLGGRPKKDRKLIEKALKLYDTKSHSIKEIVEISKISQSTLYRAIRKRKQDGSPEMNERGCN